MVPFYQLDQIHICQGDNLCHSASQHHVTILRHYAVSSKIMHFSAVCKGLRDIGLAELEPRGIWGIVNWPHIEHKFGHCFCTDGQQPMLWQCIWSDYAILCEPHKCPHPPPCIRPRMCIFIDFCRVSIKRGTGKKPTNSSQNPPLPLGEEKNKEGSNFANFDRLKEKTSKRSAKKKEIKEIYCYFYLNLLGENEACWFKSVLEARSTQKNGTDWK